MRDVSATSQCSSCPAQVPTDPRRPTDLKSLEPNSPARTYGQGQPRSTWRRRSGWGIRVAPTGRDPRITSLSCCPNALSPCWPRPAFMLGGCETIQSLGRPCRRRPWGLVTSSPHLYRQPGGARPSAAAPRGRREPLAAKAGAAALAAHGNAGGRGDPPCSLP